MTTAIVNWISQSDSFNATGDGNQYSSIATDSNGNSYISYVTINGIVSGSGNTMTSSGDIVVFKLDYYGSFQWAKQLASFNADSNDQTFQPGITVDTSANVYISYTSGDGGVVAGSGNTNAGQEDIIIFKLDTNGNNLWTIQYPTYNSTANDDRPSVIVGTNGYAYIAYQTRGLVPGTANTQSGLHDIAIVKINTTDGSVIWTRQLATFNTPDEEDLPSVCIDSNNDIIIVATTSGQLPGNTLTGSTDVYVFKLDGNDGTNLWTTQNSLFNSTFAESTASPGNIGTDANNNIYICYITNGTIPGNINSGNFDVVITKFDSSGNHIWSKQTTQFNTITDDTAFSIAVTPLGNIFVTYNTNGTVSGQTNTGGTDVVILKMDTDGNIIWLVQNNFFNTDQTNNYPYVSVYGETECFVTYYTSGNISTPGSPFTNDHITVFKLTEFIPLSTKILWLTQSDTFNSSDANNNPYIVVDLLGNSYVCYSASGIVNGSGNTQTGNPDVVVFKLNYYGVLQWAKQLSSFNANFGSNSPAIAIDSSANVYITYFSAGVVEGSGNTNTGIIDIIVFKLDTNGNNLWSIQFPSYNTDATDYFPSIAAGTNGFVYISYATSGQVSGNGNTASGNDDIAVAKIDSSDGTVIWAKQLASFNTSSFESLPSISLDSNNDAIIVAYTGGQLPGSGNTLTGGTDIYIFKLDGVTGTNLWTKQFSSFNSNMNDATSESRSIGTDANNNIYICYNTHGTIPGSANSLFGSIDVVITKFDSSGNHLWSKETMQFNTINTDTNPVISISPLGNIFLTYETSGTIQGQENVGVINVAVLKMDTNGNILWILQNNTFDTSENDRVPAIAHYGEHECFVTYSTRGNVNSPDTTFAQNQITVFRLAEISPVTIPTNIKWIRQLSDFNSALPDLRPQISVDASNNCYTCFYSVDTGVTNVVITKLDRNGNFIWKKSDLTINSVSGIQSYPAISTNPNGYSYVAYMTNSLISGSGNSLSGSYDICVTCIDKNANTIYAREFPIFNTILDDQKPSVAIDKLKNCYVCYYTNGQVQNGTSSGGQDIVIFKLDKNGNFVWSSQLSSFNTSSDETYPVIGVDEESNCYIAYNTTGTTSGNANTGGTDVAIVKLDKNGVQQWCIQSSSFNTTSPNLYPSIAVTDSGKFYMVYYTLGTISGGSSTGNYDIVVTKFDKNGNLLWIKQSSLFNTALIDEYPTVATNFCENCYVSYMTNTNGTFEIYFFQLDKNGNYISSGLVTTYGPTNLAYEADNYYPSIAVASNGQQFITFYTFGLASQDSGNTQSGQEDVVVFSVV